MDHGWGPLITTGITWEEFKIWIPELYLRWTESESLDVLEGAGWENVFSQASWMILIPDPFGNSAGLEDI